MNILPQDNTPRKKCKGPCGEWLPATPEFFHRGNGKYGIKAICKKCRAKPNEGAIVDGMKKCSNPDCENPWLPATTEYFYERKGNTSKDGLNRQCIACVKKRVTNRYQQNPEVREHKKEYDSLPENKERERQRLKQPKAVAKRRAYARRRYHEVPGVREGILAYSRLPEVRVRQRLSSLKSSRRPEVKARKSVREREYRQRPEIRERDRAYGRVYYWRPGVHERLRSYYNAYYKVYDQRLEQRLRLRVKSLTRNARKKAVKGTYTATQIAEQLKRQHYRCYYARCGFAKFERVKENGTWKYLYEIDHTFPISRVAGTDIPANDIGYLVLACPSCNSSKGNKYPHEWPQGGRLL